MKNNNYYTINLSKAVVSLSPSFLRKDILVAFLKSFVQPLEIQHNEFYAYLQDLEIETYSQICYMQGLVNDNFDFYERKIRIETLDIEYGKYLLYTRTLKKPQVCSKINSENYKPYMISMRGFIGFQEPDFAVVFPIGYTLSKYEMNNLKQLVNTNKLASKKYTIRYE